MQDFDFGKYYKRPHPAKPAQTSNAGPSPFGRKVAFLGTIVLIAFFSGMAAGIYYQKTRLVAGDAAHAKSGVESNFSANINADQPQAPESNPSAPQDNPQDNPQDKAKGGALPVSGEKSQITQTLQSIEAEYIILAKVYPSREQAHLNGMILKKEGLPVFLAENGSMMKVYVGPIAGKSKAYEMLGKVKRNPEFQGAILYKK